jgi:DNA (cytosine-5)-methyltransferase 1
LSLEAVNKAKGFRIEKLERIGSSTKRGDAELAGAFGEGFKVGALVAARNGYKLFAEGGGRRREFKLNKNSLCSYNSKALRAEHAVLVYVCLAKDVGLAKDAGYTCRPKNLHFFSPSTFRIFDPGTPSETCGEVLLDESAVTIIHSLGIRIATEEALFGYDFPKLTHVSGRDRSQIRTSILIQNVRSLLERSVKDDNTNVMPLLLKRLRQHKNTTQHNKAAPTMSIIEVQAIGNSAVLSRALAKVFRDEEGERAFPCGQSEQEHVKTQLKHRDPVVLDEIIVQLLRKGGYLTVGAELNTLYSRDNATKKNLYEGNRMAIVKGALAILNSIQEDSVQEDGIQEDGVQEDGVQEDGVQEDGVQEDGVQEDGVQEDGAQEDGVQEDGVQEDGVKEDGVKFTADQLVFVDGSTLPSAYSLKCRFDDATYFLHDGLLDNDMSTENASRRLGYHIALKCESPEGFHITYNELSHKKGFSTIHVEEIGGYHETLLSLSDDLVAREPRIRVFRGDSPILDILPSKHTKHMVTTLEPDSGYRFEAQGADGVTLVDPATESPCSATFKTGSMSKNGIDPELIGGGDECELATSQCVATFQSGAVSKEGMDHELNGGNGEWEIDSEYEFNDDNLDEDELRTIFSQDVAEDDCSLHDCDNEEPEPESNESDEERAPKRPRQENPEDKEEIVWEDRTFRRGICYICEATRSHYTILHFEGNKRNKRVTKAWCEIVLPMSMSYIGTLDPSDEALGSIYVRKMRSVPQTKILALTELVEGSPPRPDYLWESSSDDALKACVYHSFTFLNEVTSPPQVPAQPCALELFAGIGGMSRGLTEAGFDVRWLVEKDKVAAASLCQIHRNKNIFEEDVNVFVDRAAVGAKGYPEPGEAHHVHASPPCQGFSTANRSGGKNDEHNRTLSGIFPRAVKDLRPLTATMENVPGMLRQDGVYVKIIMRELVLLGYQVRLAVHVASHFGDPQKRQRLFLYASINGMQLAGMPHQTHLDRPVTVREAISDLENIEIGEAGCGVVIIKGNRVFNHNNETKTYETKLDPDQPAPTLTTQVKFGHYANDRALTDRECARFQSIPDDQTFFGSKVDIRRQVGNAVPVKMATAVATAVMATYRLHNVIDSNNSDSSVEMSEVSFES